MILVLLGWKFYCNPDHSTCLRLDRHLLKRFSLIKSHLVRRRLTHYTSMATVAGPGGAQEASPVIGEESPVHQTLEPCGRSVHQTLGHGGRPPGHLTVSDTSRTANTRTSGQPTVANTKTSGHLAKTSGHLSVSNTRTQNQERHQSKIRGDGRKAPDKKYR